MRRIECQDELWHVCLDNRAGLRVDLSDLLGGGDHGYGKVIDSSTLFWGRGLEHTVYLSKIKEIDNNRAMSWLECQSLDDVRICMVANLQETDVELEREGWILLMGFRNACDIFSQVWRHKDSSMYAYTISQNDDWDGKSPPIGGIHTTFLELLERVPTICYSHLIDE